MIQIKRINDKYLVFEVDDIRFLRQEHLIGGTLIGTLPQIPQQNVFCGLPLQLFKEEVIYLVKNGIAEVVDDSASHVTALTSQTPEDIENYEQQRHTAQQQQIKEYTEGMLERRRQALEKKGMSGKIDNEVVVATENAVSYVTEATTTNETLEGYNMFSKENVLSDLLEHVTSAQYYIFNFLHARGYFLSPGLRFGGNFLAYPGDSVRYHSHYIAIGKEYEEKFPIKSVIVGGGRLGTNVKKCLVLGGENEEGGDSVYCIEWSGFG